MSSRNLDRKRHRCQGSSNEDGNDSDVIPHSAGHKSSQAERKRELERNRRHVINVRFAELDAELRRSAPRADGQQPNEEDASDNSKMAPVKGRRIDKEAVLKEAIQRLALKDNDVKVLTTRVESMATEIHNLRAEKVELREDKTYLRGELETLRAETKRLRAHNVQLLHTIGKMSAMKLSSSPIVANQTMETFHHGKPPSGNSVKPVCEPSSALPVTMPASSSVVCTLPGTSSNPIPQLPAVNREDVISPVTGNRSPEQLQSAITDQHPRETVPKSSDIATAPASESILSQDVFSFQTADDFNDLFANFSPSAVFFDDTPPSNAVGNEFQGRSMSSAQSLMQPLMQPHSSPSPELTRAATIAAATIAARAQNSSQHHALPTGIGSTTNGGEANPMVVSLSGERASNPSAFHASVNAQAEGPGRPSIPSSGSPSFPGSGSMTPGGQNILTSNGNNNPPLTTSSRPNISDVAYCV